MHLAAQSTELLAMVRVLPLLAQKIVRQLRGSISLEGLLIQVAGYRLSD
jgi:hypothetical protein